MKTKEEILKMTKTEILKERWEVKVKENPSCSSCSYCWDCSYCSYCWDCSDCSDCFGCFKQKGLKYAIANVVFTKEEYEAKMKEINSK